MGLFTSKAERERQRDQRMRTFIRTLDRKENEIIRNLDELKKLALEAKRIEDNERFAMIRNRYQQTQSRRKNLERMRLQVKMLLQDRQMASVFTDFCGSMRDFANSMRDVFSNADLDAASKAFNQGMDQMEQQSSRLDDALSEVDQRFTDGAANNLDDDSFDRLISDELVHQEQRDGLGQRINKDLKDIERELGG